MEERWLDAANVLECTLEEDQHRGVEHLVLIVGMSLAVEAVHVPAELLHPVQDVTAAPGGREQNSPYCLPANDGGKALRETLHLPEAAVGIWA